MSDADGGTVAPSALDAALEDARAWTEAALERALPGDVPPRLAAAMRHGLLAGGKRLRPALCRWFAEGLGADAAAAEAPAVALELVHSYSLVHDDLPCMDDDDLRRGRPTVHVAFDEATAVLVGDALLTLAFEVLAEHPAAGELVGVLARASGAVGMVGGQALDLAFGALADPGADEVRDVHARKTGALFAAAAELGTVVAGGDAAARAEARRYGAALGLCFQATDDLLDVTGSAEDLGKTPGKDARLARPSLALVLGVEAAREAAERVADEARTAAEALGLGPGTPPHDLVGAVLARRR